MFHKAFLRILYDTENKSSKTKEKTMSNNRAPATPAITVQVRLDDSAVSKDKIPAPAELSELMGRSVPFHAYSDLRSTREWGKMTAIYGMTLQNVQSLPSLRGKQIRFSSESPVRNQQGELKDFMTHAVFHPSALFQTLPFWDWEAPTGDESKTKNFFTNLLSNAVRTPNIIYGFASTLTEIAAKAGGTALAQPFHFLWKGVKMSDEKDKNTNKPLGFFSRLARSIPSVFTQPFKNIKTGFQNIKKSWENFSTDNQNTPLWKKVLKGIGLGVTTVAKTVGLAIASIPVVSWPLAIAGWLAGQTLLYASNALNYVRYFIDGLTTLAVNAPKALANDADKITICKSAAKTMGKSALLLLPTAAILAAVIFIPGAQVLPAITPLIAAKLSAAIGLTAAGAQLTSGLVNYQFSVANFKKVQALAATSNQQIAKAITSKPAIKAKPVPVTEKTPLLAAFPSDATIAEEKIATPIARTVTPIQTAAPHHSVLLELQDHENIHDKIRDLRKTFLSKRSSSTIPSAHAVIQDNEHHDTVIPRTHPSFLYHQHLRWNEHQDNAWAEYRRHDTHQYVSEIVTISAGLNPQMILQQAIQDESLRETLKPALKIGIKQLRDTGAAINKTNLFALVQDEALAQTLADHYKKTTRQTITHHYTHSQHEYPSDSFIDLAIRQVDSFIKMHGAKKTLTLSAAWDVSYVEAILLYAASQDCKCENKSTYSIPAFSAAHIETFKDLINKKPYLGHRHADQNKSVLAEIQIMPTLQSNPI
jgi:hypothetical protein